MTNTLVFKIIRKAMQVKWGSRDDAVVRALTSHQCGPDVISRLDISYMWAEFVVGSRPCSERFFSGYSGFPLS